MFEFLFGKKNNEVAKDIFLNEIYAKLKSKYDFSNISDKRKSELKSKISAYGYLPYPFIKALEELTPEETLYGLEIKWSKNKIFKDGKFEFSENQISPLARHNVVNSDWIKKEGHDIKLINLAGLGNGNENKDAGKFLDWLKQLLILPTGEMASKIFDTTIYLIPFHPREFGCAYLPRSSEVSLELLDKDIETLTGLDAKGQVKLFIELAQLAGHPVIYDILPQTGRFSKAVLANPQIARWYDIEKLQNLLDEKIDSVAQKLKEKYDSEDIDVVRDIYRQSDSIGTLSEQYQQIFNAFDNEMDNIKKELSENMLAKYEQANLQRRIREVIAKTNETKPNQKLTEEDIVNQVKIIQSLIAEGLWPAPGGAWCSSGVPVYDKMSECGGYPLFKHYNNNGEDVTNFANLDCQTPYYFVNLEDGTYNEAVIDYFVDYLVKLQAEYNFDGFRVDHTDHIVDEVSQKNGVPISYRAPATVLNKVNSTVKKKLPYFGTLAEYMLWDNYLKEYHEDMNFDLLWGNDIVSQQEKTPEKITEDNQNLTNYNVNLKEGNRLSILKTYNNQDGEFRSINQYPGQLGADGALFKWAKYKLLPGGKFAQRSILYVDGDESFTPSGIEGTIGEEISMQREKNYEFFAKFDAIDRFVKSQPIITDGEAQILIQEDDGFSAWLISKEPLKKAFLVVANYNYPTEMVTTHNEDGTSYSEVKEGTSVTDKIIKLPGDFSALSEYVFKENRYIQQRFENPLHDLEFNELKPAEFKIYSLEKRG